LLALLAQVNAGWGAEELDAEFWDSYRPYQQYSAATLSDLFALQEEDLLGASRGTDGVVLRLIGRRSASSPLVSARIGIDSIARLRLVAKVLAQDPTATVPVRPEIHRVPVSPGQAERFLALLQQWNFWDAPYRLADAPVAFGSGGACANSAGWLIEGVMARSYQLIVRSDCGGLDPAAAEIRDFLLELAGIQLAASPPVAASPAR
jgi:hypothetical protein